MADPSLLASMAIAVSSDRTMSSFMAVAPGWLRSAFTAVDKWKRIDWSKGSDDEDGRAGVGVDDGRKPCTDLIGAEAISSRFDGEGDESRHVIMLDIDRSLIMIESSTPGHAHLIFDVTTPWPAYARLLDALAECGVIEEGYAKASIARKATYLRLPWIRKGTERQDAQRAIEEWLDEPPENLLKDVNPT